METVLSIAQLVIALILIVLVLIQDRGEGLSETFGGGQGGFSHGRRGIERITYVATIVGLVLFAIISLANLLI